MKKRHSLVLVLSAMVLLSGCFSSLSGKKNERIDAMQAAKHLALGCHMYAQDNDGMLPTTTTHLLPYVDITYDPEAFVMVATGKLSEVEQPEKAVLLRQKASLSGGSQAVAYDAATCRNQIIKTNCANGCENRPLHR
jgi:hypothetical protein